jgi:putative component of membrane protein insertase Oxa1/YidC/SpoIIIJ protein YidD
MTAAVPVNQFACWLIRCYQRHLSPYKGFCCAYRVLRGRHSCSQFASRAIRRRGLVSGIRMTQRRFDRCRWASYVLDYDRARRKRDRRERPLWCVNGWDPSCDGGDVAGCLLEGAGELAGNACCEVAASGCHW